MKILLPDRFVQVELAIKLSNERGSRTTAKHDDGWVAGDQTHQQKDDHADAEQHRNHLQNATDRIPSHSRQRITWRWSPATRPSGALRTWLAGERSRLEKVVALLVGRKTADLLRARPQERQVDDV